MTSKSADVDPRVEADAQITRALQVVVDAGPDGEAKAGRDYTSDELETLLFSLTTALTQLRKVPGGADAHAKFHAGLKDELRRRGRPDIEDELALVIKTLDELGAPSVSSEGRALSAEARIRLLFVFGRVP